MVVHTNGICWRSRRQEGQEFEASLSYTLEGDGVEKETGGGHLGDGVEASGMCEGDPNEGA